MNRRRAMLALGMLGGKAAPVVPWYLAGDILPENCIAAYQAIGAADISASMVNLANPGTYDLTVPTGSPPTFNTATGWASTQASPKYWDTGITPVYNTTSYIARFANGVNNENWLLGICKNDFSKYFRCAPSRTTADQWGLEIGSLLVGTGEVSTGTIGYGTNCFINGVKVANGARVSVSFTQSLWLMGVHREGTSAAHRDFEGNLLACAFYNIQLSDSIMSALHNAITTLP